MFAINTYTLTVDVTGSGTVGKNPSQVAYDHGTVVRLTATPAANWHFVEWTGDLSGSVNPADITMDSNKSDNGGIRHRHPYVDGGRHRQRVGGEEPTWLSTITVLPSS